MRGGAQLLANRGEWNLCESLTPIKHFQPVPQALLQRLDIDPPKLRRQRIEPPESIPQQRCRSNQVPSLQVVKCSRGLDQCLEERLLLSLQLQPDGLPMLVRMPELLGAITSQTFCKVAGGPVKAHLFAAIQVGWHVQGSALEYRREWDKCVRRQCRQRWCP